MRVLKRLIPLVLSLALIAVLMTAGLSLPSGHSAAAIEDTNGTVKSMLTSAARTTTGTSSAACGLTPFTKFGMQILVTVATGTTPTLDVTWQHSIDGGTTWYTVATFTQVTTVIGNQLKVEAEVEAATAEVYGDCMRLSYVIAGTTPSYTFSADLFAE